MSLQGKIWAVQDELIIYGHFQLNRDGLAGPKTWGVIASQVASNVSPELGKSLAPVIRGVQTVLKSHGLYEGRIDGDAGDLTWDAIKLALDAELKPGTVLPPPPPVVPPAAGEVDARSEHAILTLHPKMQDKARRLIIEANAALAPHGLHLVVTSGTRTYAEQSALYAEGRTAPGQRVTNAPAGWSNHNFGLAFDVTIFRGGDPVWDSPLYASVIAGIGKALGFDWGGDWKGITDEPHYELRPDWAKGISEGAFLTGLRARHDAGLDVFAALAV